MRYRITFEGRKAKLPDGKLFLGVNGDNLIDVVAFAVPEYEGAAAYVKLRSQGAKYAEYNEFKVSLAYDDETGDWVLDVSRAILALGYKIETQIQLEAPVNGDDVLVWQSEIFPAYVSDTIKADDAIPEQQAPYLQELDLRVQGFAQRAENASRAQPYVGANGNWYVWDANSMVFVDSGAKAQGPQGPATIEVDSATSVGPAKVENVGTSQNAKLKFTLPAATGVGVSLSDAGGYFPEKNAEAALQKVASQLAAIDNLAPHHTYAVTWELGSITSTGALIPNPTSTGVYNMRSNGYVATDGHDHVTFPMPADLDVYVVAFYSAASQATHLTPNATASGQSGTIDVPVPEGANYFKIAIGRKAEIVLTDYNTTTVYDGTPLLVDIANAKNQAATNAAGIAANVAAIAENSEAIEGILENMVSKDTIKKDFSGVVWELGYVTSDGSTVNNPSGNGYYYIRTNAYVATDGAANVAFDMPYGLITYAVYFFGTAAKASLISVVTYAGPPRKAVIAVPEGANYFKAMIGTNASIVLADYSGTKIYESIYNGEAMVSIIDDDGVLAAAQSWERISDALGGIPVTMALITSHIGDTYGGNQQVTWGDVRRLKAKGFEFISHSNGHEDLTTLSESELEADFDATQQALDDHNCTPGFLAYPFNANNAAVHGVAKKHFQGAFKGSNTVNEIPINPFELTRVNLFNLAGDAMLSLSAMKSWVDSAIAKKGWLVFMAHNYYPFVDATAEATLIKLCQYIKESGGKIVSISEGFKHFSGLS